MLPKLPLVLSLAALEIFDVDASSTSPLPSRQVPGPSWSKAKRSVEPSLAKAGVPRSRFLPEAAGTAVDATDFANAMDTDATMNDPPVIHDAVVHSHPSPRSSNRRLSHDKLAVPFDATTPETGVASPGVEFFVENALDDRRRVTIAGLGLRVVGGPSTAAPFPCRVRIHVERVAEGRRSAMDANDVRCMGPDEETTVPSEKFLEYYREVWTTDDEFDDDVETGHVELPEMGFLSGNDTAVSSAHGPGWIEAEKGYPWLIPPGTVLSLYVVVLPAEGNETFEESPKLLSGNGSEEFGLYASDAGLNLYEGSSVLNGTLLSSDGENQVLEVVKPTVFHGAIYYDVLDDGDSLSDYYDALEKSLLPGDALHGYPGCDKSLSTGYVDTIGSYGIMFDLTSIAGQEDGINVSHSRNVDIFGMDVYIRNIVNASIEVYVRHNGNKTDYLSYMEQPGQTNIAQNWDLIAKGIVEGKGANVGTPIPSEAWYKNVVLRPGQTVGVYVAVQGDPHLRYRETHLKEGDVFSSDGVLAVRVGRSWGEHPLRGDGNDVYFAPREFSGAFRYHAHDGICDSSAPSLAPSTSIAPTIIWSANPTGIENECLSRNSLTTTFRDGTGSHGNLFDVLVKTNLTLTGMDLNVGSRCDFFGLPFENRSSSRRRSLTLRLIGTRGTRHPS